MSYDYEKTHEMILKSARKIFSRVGFRNASIRNICKDAGVTNGAFYAHFESKDALFAALVSEKLAVFNETYQDMSEIHINSVDDVMKIFEISYKSIETLIHYVYSEKEVFMLILKSSGGTSYENFVEGLIDAECQNTIRFFEKEDDRRRFDGILKRKDQPFSRRVKKCIGRKEIGIGLVLGVVRELHRKLLADEFSFFVFEIALRRRREREVLSFGTDDRHHPAVSSVCI